MPVSAEGLVEQLKFTQVAALLSVGWVFSANLDSLEKSVLGNA